MFADPLCGFERVLAIAAEIDDAPICEGAITTDEAKKTVGVDGEADDAQRRFDVRMIAIALCGLCRRDDALLTALQDQDHGLLAFVFGFGFDFLVPAVRALRSMALMSSGAAPLQR